MEKWRGKHGPDPEKGYSGELLFRFGRRINSHINVATTAEGVASRVQPFCIQCHGSMLMARIRFTAGEQSSSCFHQRRKARVQMGTHPRRWNQTSDTGAVGKVMQPVTLLHQTCPKTGVTVQGSPHRGRSLCIVGMRCPGSVSDTIKSSQKIG